jgi:deoxyribose-phosphate aldolase
MDIKEILSKVDHTYLNQAAVWDDIKKTLDEGIQYSTASACIPPSFVKRAKEYVGDRLKICTVTGFPNGYSTALVKCYESSEAVSNGADEIDTVIDIGDLKSQNYDKILKDLKDIKEACQGRILKVIIETCLLTDYEKQKMCEIVSCSGADFIKTSTGFSTGGATRDDIILFSKYVAPHVKIKAAGGISTLKDAEDYISLGASRLGTSRIVKLVKKDGETNGNTTY